ncbi:alpha-galactosidase [Leuconostoc gelidum subsp. gelidum]|nr:alpha-galactosidase [Leuconostoc gelidum subsp. gelidum]
MEVVDGYLVHRYWGKTITHYNFSNRPMLKKRTFSATPNIDQPELSPEFIPFEAPTSHMGDYRNAAVCVINPNQQDVVRFSYVGFNILNQAPELVDLPFARNSDEKVETLIIHLFDDISKIQLDLNYTIFENHAIVVRSSTLKNMNSNKIILEKLLSASIDVCYSKQNLTTFYGTHQKEYQINRGDIHHGLFKIGSSRGNSGPQYPPYLAVSEDATEFHGEVHAMTLLYSGNHEEIVERDQYNNLRLQIGLNSETFSWPLNQGESFQSPQALLAYSEEGFNGNSQVFHHFFKEHLINPNWTNKARPIVINSWEITYFDVNDTLIRELIDSASELGFETVVLDDGWFKQRNSSQTSLGDWTVDLLKFPYGIKTLVDYARKRNIGFGIWFEPEMISPNSELIKKHPNWVMRAKNYEPILGRNQYYLDLTNNDVQMFIINTLSKVITECGINYIKWDMNRHITDPFSPINDHKKPGQYFHNYMVSLYHTIDQLTKKFPDVLFENCSSGGGRLDPGMLYYFPQTWVSDNTDAFDRQQIQYNASYLFPTSSITGHVSVVPNHQTNRIIPLNVREALASSTNMGYELDIIKMDSDKKERIKEHLKTYKAERNLILNGNFYRLSSPNDSNSCSWIFVDDNQDKAIVYHIRNTYNTYDLSLTLRIPYLDVHADYLRFETNQIYSGSELANCGLAFENIKGDYQVNKIILQKIVEN